MIPKMVHASILIAHFWHAAILIVVAASDVAWGQTNCSNTSDCLDLVQFCDISVNDTEGICWNCTECFTGQSCTLACADNVTTSTEVPTTFTSTTQPFNGVRVSTFNYDDPDPDHKLLQVIVPILAFLLFFAFACCAIYRPDDCHELWDDLKRECACWMTRRDSGEDGGETRRDLIARRRQVRELREQAELNELLGVQGLRDAAVAAALGGRGDEDRVRANEYAAAEPIYNDAIVRDGDVADNRNAPVLAARYDINIENPAGQDEDRYENDDIRARPEGASPSENVNRRPFNAPLFHV